jgi:hypothetical protein
MPTSRTVENTIPKVIVVADKRELEAIESTCRRADAFPVAAENLQDADALLADITKRGRDIEAKRKELKAPVLDLGRAIDHCAKQAIEPLDAAKRSLRARIGAVQDDLERKRQADMARARAEQQRLEAERQRLEAERAAALAEQRRREAALAEKAAGADVEVPAEVEVPEPVPEPAPVEVVVAPAVKTSVHRRQNETLEIDEPARIPYRATPTGEPLFTPNRAAIKRALKAGLDVPGCRLSTETGYVNR